MKPLFLRAGLVLACALALSSCGGGKGTLALGGTVSNVTKAGLILQNNGGDDLAVAAGATTFYFPTLISTDTDYNVTVKASPPNADCAVYSGGKGRSATYDVVTVLIACVIHQHALGGTVRGLTANGLVLVNGANQVAVPANATTFSMAAVNEDAAYGITILSQPANQTCTVGNSTGTVGTTDVNTVQVTCN